ncbi:hypothetical protein C0J52_00525 [Blattella germanica]|nr:hypothetical protein C0J52_00525 [Blattella germanica]
MLPVLAHCHGRADAHTQQLLLGSALATIQRQLCSEHAVGIIKSMAFWEGYIRVYCLSECKCSYPVMINNCKISGIIISRSTISKVIKQCKSQAPNDIGRPEKIKIRRAQHSRTPTLIKQVKSKVMRKNPPTQKIIARRKGISQTVGLVIHENPYLQKWHKARGHHLEEKHIEERFTNARKIYERHFAVDR